MSGEAGRAAARREPDVLILSMPPTSRERGMHARTLSTIYDDTQMPTTCHARQQRPGILICRDKTLSNDPFGIFVYEHGVRAFFRAFLHTHLLLGIFFGGHPFHFGFAPFF